MSTTRSVVGKLTYIKLNTTKAKANGEGSFQAHLLKIDAEDGEQKFIIAAKTPSAVKMEPYLQKLSVGEEVTVCLGKNGKYENVFAVKKGRVAANGSRSTGGKSTRSTGVSRDVTGMIKGNSVSNGVLIAIARKGADVTAADVLKAAKEVLSVHDKLDNGESKASAKDESDGFDDEPKKTKGVEEDDEELVEDEDPF